MSRVCRELRSILCRLRIAAVLLISVCVLPCFAQQDHQAAIRRVVKEAVQRRVQQSLTAQFPGGVPTDTPRELYGTQYNQLAHLYALLLLGDTLGARALADATEARTDTQPGGQAGSSGATSLVTKGLAPKVLSWAVEHGALDRSVNGTTVTFRGNPSGLARAVSQTNLIDVMLPDRSWWNGLSFAVAFDMTRGSDRNTLLANRQQISSWSVRSEVLNRRDPTASGFQRQAEEIADPFLRQIQDFDVSVDPVLSLALEEYRAAWEPALASRADLRDWIAKGFLFTADWTVARDPQIRDLHTVTLVMELSPDRARRHDLTLNGSVSFYRNSPATNTSSFRDSKVTAQYDIPLQTGTSVGIFVLTLAGRWEHIHDSTPVSTTTLEALTLSPTAGVSTGQAITPMIAPGNVGVFQFKLSIPVKGAGIQIPLALAASNRKAQIQGKWNVGANFGVTFNFDSFLAAFKAK